MAPRLEWTSLRGLHALRDSALPPLPLPILSHVQHRPSPRAVDIRSTENWDGPIARRGPRVYPVTRSKLEVPNERTYCDVATGCGRTYSCGLRDCIIKRS